MHVFRNEWCQNKNQKNGRGWGRRAGGFVKEANTIFWILKMPPKSLWPLTEDWHNPIPNIQHSTTILRLDHRFPTPQGFRCFQACLCLRTLFFVSPSNQHIQMLMPRRWTSYWCLRLSTDLVLWPIGQVPRLIKRTTLLMIKGHVLRSYDMSNDHKTFAMIIGHLLRSLEVRYDRRTSPMMIGHVLRSYDMSTDQKTLLMTIGDVLGY